MDRGAWWAAAHGVTKDSDLTGWQNNGRTNLTCSPKQQAKFPAPPSRDHTWERGLLPVSCQFWTHLLIYSWQKNLRTHTFRILLSSLSKLSFQDAQASYNSSWSPCPAVKLLWELSSCPEQRFPRSWPNPEWLSTLHPEMITVRDSWLC